MPPIPELPPLDMAQEAGEFACLVDVAGVVFGVATPSPGWLAFANPVGRRLAELLEVVDLDALLGRVLCDGDEFKFTAPGFFGASAGGALAQVHLRRIELPVGSSVLVCLRQLPDSPASDALTGLPDRRALAPQIAAWRAAGADSLARFAVLFVDLNNFKQVNDEHGHAIGDKILREAARRMRTALRETDLVVRYGGDEFVILLHGVSAVDEAEPVIARLKHAIAAPLQVAGTQMHISASIGVATTGEPYVPIKKLVDAADQDMYARKRRRPR